MNIRHLIFLALTLLCGIGPALAQEDQAPLRTFEYTPETLAEFRRIAVQDGGRVKPLGTLADFKLLRFHGKRSIKVDGLAVEGKLDSAAWLLDCFFFPEQARNYNTFIIHFKDVAVAIGLNLDDKDKRDRYSYNDLRDVRQNLVARAEMARRKENKDRNPVERQILVLLRNMAEFEDLCRLTQFSGLGLNVSGVTDLDGIFADPAPDLVEFMRKGDSVSAALLGAEATEPFQRLSHQIDNLTFRSYGGLGLFPTSSAEASWLSWSEMVSSIMEGDQDSKDNLDAMGQLGAVREARGDGGQFASALTAWATTVKDRARAIGAFDKIPMEVNFYKYDFFYRALVIFLFAFLLVALSWLTKIGTAWNRQLARGSGVLSIVGLILLVVGITYRCILRDRPPITTLYETILFIGATMVLLCLIIERFEKSRIGLALAALSGTVFMFMAGRYEMREAATVGDTMPSLVAVLDTNFWLATHVTIINLGYAAGLLVALLAHVWLYLYFFKSNSMADKLTPVARMMYGVLCFSLLTSVVGTILGGVWANDSWGRFWGWDPKENGALMICIWELIMLHGRMGGFLRKFGMAIMGVLLGCVVAFSWWGVNLLGVGLHSYGFTEGVGFWLKAYIYTELIIVGAALMAVWYRSNFGGKAKVA